MDYKDIAQWLSEQVVAEQGLLDARLIAAYQIVTAHWVRMKCRYGCPNYQHHLDCSPFSPDVEMFRKVLAEYQWAAVLKVVEASPGPADGLLLKLELALCKLGFRKALALGSRSCGLCNPCVRTAEGCPHPERIRPELSSLGIDTTALIHHVGWELIPWTDVPPKKEDIWLASLLLID